MIVKRWNRNTDQEEPIDKPEIDDALGAIDTIFQPGLPLDVAFQALGILEAHLVQKRAIALTWEARK